MFGRRAFSVAGLMAWNLLPDTICDPTRALDSFRRYLKTFPFSVYTSVYSALKGCSTVQKIVNEIGKPCSTMQKIVIEIVIEIYMKQTRLFQCYRFHYADFHD